jgi:hypothetical protein
MYEINGIQYSLEELTSAAESNGMSLDDFVSALEKKHGAGSVAASSGEPKKAKDGAQGAIVPSITQASNTASISGLGSSELASKATQFDLSSFVYGEGVTPPSVKDQAIVDADAFIAQTEKDEEFQLELEAETEKIFNNQLSNLNGEIPWIKDYSATTELEQFGEGVKANPIKAFKLDASKEFVKNNKTIQQSILPRIQAEVAADVKFRLIELQEAYGLNKPNTYTEENYQSYLAEANKYYNQELNKKIQSDKQFSGLLSSFNENLNSLAGAAQTEFTRDQNTPSFIKAAKILGEGLPVNPGEVLEKIYRWGPDMLTKSEKLGISLSANETAARQKHFDRNLKNAETYGWTDDTVGYFVDDPGRVNDSMRFDPKEGISLGFDADYGIVPNYAEGKEITWGEFKAKKEADDLKRNERSEERLLGVLEDDIIASSFNDNEWDKITEGIEVGRNVTNMVASQLPNMLAAVLTLGGFNAVTSGSDIYWDSIQNRNRELRQKAAAKEGFVLSEKELYAPITPLEMQAVLSDDSWNNKATLKAAAGGATVGQLERIGAAKAFKPFVTSGVKSILRGGGKQASINFAKGVGNMSKGGFSETLTEIAQGLVQDVVSGNEINVEGLIEAGGTGFIIGSVLPGVANFKNQSIAEIKTTANVIAGKLNPKSSEALFNVEIQKIDGLIKSEQDPKTKQDLIDKRQAIFDVRNANTKIPSNFSEQSRKESLDLLIEKESLKEAIEGKDPDLVKNAEDRLAQINGQLQTIADAEIDVIKGEKLLKKSGMSGDVKATETDQEFADQLRSIKNPDGTQKYSEEKIAEGINTRFGVFIAEDGSIVVNKAAAKRAGVTTTTRHEFLHRIILSAVNSSAEGTKQIGSDLMAFLESEFGKSIKGDASNLLADLNAYKAKAAESIAVNEAKLAKFKTWLNQGAISQTAYDTAVKDAAGAKAKLEANAMEEALTLMSEALANGELSYNASFMTKVRDFIRRFLQTIPGAAGNIDLADGRATFDFIRDYNRSFDKGKFNKAFKKFSQKGTLEGVEIKESTKITPEQKKLNEKVDNLVGPKDAEGNYTVTKAEWDTGALFNAYNEIINGTAIDALIVRGIEGDSVYGKSKQDFIDDVKDGITGTIMRFNPEENNSLIGFINSQLAFRKGDVLNKYKKESGITGKSIDVAAGETGSIAELAADETSEDSLDAEELLAQQELDLNKKPTFLESLPVDQKVDGNKTYQEALQEETSERVKRNVQLYDQKVSQNRTISPFVAELKMDISDAFYKPTKKFINEYKGGYEGFLNDFKPTLLNNYTTTYLARHPLFRKGIVKRVKGQWMPPRKININGIFKYEWVDKNGKKLKIDRDNAAGRGLTSGPEFIKRSPSINSIIGTNEFIDYHFQDGALRQKKKQNPEDAVARQIASETALEIFQNDLLENGPLTKLFEDRAELLGKILSDNAAITIASDIDRGLIKFSEKSMKKPKIAPIHNKALNILADQGQEAMDTYLGSLKDQDVADLVKNYFDNRLWENGLFADAKARNRGLAYENYIKKVIRASKAKDVSVSMIGRQQKTGGDIILSIGKNKIPIELKLNDVAQMSSFTARIADDGAVSFSRKGLDDAAGVKDLKEILSSKDYAAKVAAFQEEGLKFAKEKNLYAEVINGRLVAQKAVFEYLVENGEQAKLNVTVDSNESIINALYNDKDVYYMDLGNKGLFHLGEDVNRLNTPRLASPVQLYARWTRSSKIDGQDRYTASLRVFPSLTGDINKSTISLSDPANIKDVLNDLNFQEQNTKESTKINTEVNRMIQDVSDIPADEIISKARGRSLGQNKKGALFVPYSHEDFLGLMYPLVGKGKQGDADLSFIKNTILTPFAKAEHAITRERLNTAAGFRALKKQINKELGSTSLSKELGKEAVDGFTNEDAIRIWLWDNQQMDIVGLNEKDIAKIKNKVMKNPALAMYALKLRGLLNGEYPAPSTNWQGSNISYDIQQNLENTRREFHLKTWQENVDKMFSTENKAKLEAAFGPKYVEALNNMLQRMKTGRNRTQNNSRIENALLDYLNGSVAAIMALNTKSALLQQLSNVNFINWTDNNPLKAAQAFANQPRYWRDVVDLLNSDYLRNRRSGLKINVTESELAEAAKSKNKVTAFIGLLGQKGFVLTQYGDSFAIASGGATFFRNRLKTYSKETDADGNKLYTEEQAKEKAMADFMEISEDNQQSSRTDKISMQQASNLGRLFLAFANTPAQYARLTKKAVLDLSNGRGDPKTNISKMLYYGFVQNLYFSFLQKGLFSMLFDDDDADEEKTQAVSDNNKKKAFDMANNAFDSVLRGGGGIGGATLAMAKNLIIKGLAKYKKYDNDERPNFADLSREPLQISPPISAKFTKLRQAGAAFDYNKWEIENRGLALDNPALLAGARGTTAITNIPLDRLIIKAKNLQSAMNSDLETWQRVASALGWQDWELGIVDPKAETEDAQKEVEGKAKSKATRDKNAAEKAAAEKLRRSLLTKEEKAFEDYNELMKKRKSSKEGSATRKKNKATKDSLSREMLMKN